MNSVSILFSWHKNFGGVIGRHGFLPWRKVSHRCRETNSELERIFNSYQYHVKNYVIDLFSYLHCWKCVLMKATCEREIFKLFQVTKCKGCYSFKLEKNTKRKISKLNIFYLVEKIVRFHVDCRPQIRIVYLKPHCSQWGPWIGINGQLAVCFSKLLGFIQYNIFVYCKLAQWRVADPREVGPFGKISIFGLS